MFRAILAAFLGYATMVAGVMAGIAGLWFSLGNEFAFADASLTASVGWSMCLLICGLIAALAGGWVAALAGGPKGGLAVRVLVGLIIVFGTVSLASQIDYQPTLLPPGKSIAEVTFLEAGEHAVSPMWYNVAIVVVGGIGTWLGGRFGQPQPAKANHEPPTRTANR